MEPVFGANTGKLVAIPSYVGSNDKCKERIVRLGTAKMNERLEDLTNVSL